MKQKSLFYIFLFFLIVFGLYRVFRNQLGVPRKYEIAGVEFKPSPEFYIIDLSTPGKSLSDSDIADRLEQELTGNPDQKKIGIRFHQNGSTVYFMADLGKDVLERYDSGRYGVAIQTVWTGKVLDRIRRGKINGNFDPEGLSAGMRKNLYH